jgi:hypothetical protein
MIVKVAKQIDTISFGFFCMVVCVFAWLAWHSRHHQHKSIVTKYGENQRQFVTTGIHHTSDFGPLVDELIILVAFLLVISSAW